MADKARCAVVATDGPVIDADDDADTRKVSDCASPTARRETPTRRRNLLPADVADDPARYGRC